jgi:uncharacterized protein (TIGR02145 family)
MRTKLTIFLAPLIIIVSISMALNSCKQDSEIPNLPLSCKIISPLNGEVFELGSEVNFSIELKNQNATVSEILLFKDDINIVTFYNSPYEFKWNTADLEIGNYTFCVKAINSEGEESKMDEIELGIYVPYVFDFGSVSDYEGNTYKTITIGEQTWMAENLKSKVYAIGMDIPGVYAYNNDESNVDIYGRLYTWKAAMNYSTDEGVQGVCPNGWHLPTNDEWKILEKNLGMCQADLDTLGMRGTNEGGKLKKVDTNLWNLPNIAATNESGFSALPGGWRTGTDKYGGMGRIAYFWSSSSFGRWFADYRRLSFDEGGIYYYDYYHNRDAGRSVRCIKNDTTID